MQINSKYGSVIKIMKWISTSNTLKLEDMLMICLFEGQRKIPLSLMFASEFFNPSNLVFYILNIVII